MRVRIAPGRMAGKVSILPSKSQLHRLLICAALANGPRGPVHPRTVMSRCSRSPLDRDPICGYTGVIEDVCPGCGRAEGGVRFERIRRITGYLVGTLDRFNDAKKAEEHDRVRHAGTEQR